ncbi:PIN domain-containing protein [Leptolyngbya sp. KIOST-1]|uniref:PIN domain-containing protein n=1 Tax=Leptolyngbya sp. KIOST-1 TaxID=1229172 RepID=UPI00056772CA|nr:PIN domain-containing protein [Leptolyngbya sp. KIOST-1]
MKVLVDTNIVLDVILEREPFVESATDLFALIENGKIQGYIAATTITNIFYIVRKLEGREVALDAIARLLRGFNLCAVESQVIQRALELNLPDFEDGVQLACAVLGNLDAIAIRDGGDFQGVNFTILSTASLVAQFALEK